MKSASWINLALGAIVFATPFFTVTSQGAFWSAVIVGALIGVLAIFDLYEEMNDKAERVRGPAIVNALAGIWLVIAAFVVSASMAYLWITGVAGLIAVFTSGYNASESSKLQRRARHT